ITEHMHPDAREIFHILKGEMRVTIEKESWNLPADSLLIIEPGERHSFNNHGSEDCVFVYTLMLCDQL
ncbi:MAG: cupin domain-containing protein, partial [Verrucomicrobiae bacterium]|nr:cupin domain-containing protein [Verrucomicrobiae bacterium]